MAAAIDWSSATAPSLAEFEVLAQAAFQQLPDAFRKLCDGVAIRVEDFATNEVLDELGIQNPFELMGLYQGVSLGRKSVLDVPQQPDMVFLYRRALLDYWAEGDESLGSLVTHVLVHEIGHHFGLSDADMADIEASATSGESP
jgi:predicted Zn-dependent protease with MMP-like domain